MFHIVKVGDRHIRDTLYTREEADAVLEGRSLWFSEEEEVISDEEHTKRLRKAMLDIEFGFCNARVSQPSL